MKKIGIIGTGGVGGYFGAKMLTHLNREEYEISFIARGEHLKAIKRDGLTVKTETEGTILVRPHLVTSDFSLLPKLDLVLLCVKAFDLNTVLKQLCPSFEKETWIMPLLNGVDIPERIKSVYPDANILPSCVYIGTHIKYPGIVNQKGGSCRIFWGKDLNAPPDWVSVFLDKSKINHLYLDNPLMEIWTKYIFITSYGLITAALNKTIGEVLSDNDTRKSLQRVIAEVAAVGRSSGIHLKKNCEEECFQKGFQFPAETKTSFQRDYENPEKKDEREIFAGTVISLAKKYKVAVPETTRFFNIL